ncbi:MAG: monovalent cation/H+ antiporter subunit D [Myxococcota bacterium]
MLPIAMVVLPMFIAAVSLWVGARAENPDVARDRQRALGRFSLVAMVPLAIMMLQATDAGEVAVVRLGNWPSPFAITLVVDRLSALMVTLTVVLTLFVEWGARDGAEAEGPYFHPLLQFQVMGLNGAFMTGDLFNLFVFFEILLIASYALLLFGQGKQRLRAALHYIVLNLVGSCLFLIAVGVIYGLLGTLNMADLAAKAALVPAADAPLLKAGALLLLLVFGIKAAIVPVHLWLPSTYHAAAGPVSALFAIMTKVGMYAIIRVFIPIFGPGQGEVASVAEPWVLPVGLATLVVGTLGVLAANDFKKMLTYVVVASVGTQAIAVGLFTQQGLAAAVFYIAHSTLLTAGFFLLADAVILRRGEVGGRLSAGPLIPSARALAVLYLVAAMSTVGLPPLSGFVGKALLLAAVPTAWQPAVWTVTIVTSFVMLVQLARIGSVLFWNISSDREATPEVPPGVRSLAPAASLLTASVVISLFGQQLDTFSRATAAQIYDRARTIERVMTDAEPPPKDPQKKKAQKKAKKEGGDA